MEILFKSDDKVFFIEDDELDWNYNIILDINLNDIIHIKELPILYHIIDDTFKYPVYYEYKDRCIIFDGTLNYYYISYNAYQKDYTQANINNIINGNII